jgi:hypothetical protein
MLGLETAVRLPLSFDAALLKRDLEAVEAARLAFVPHYGEYHDGGWSAIGLVGQGGDPRNLRAGNGEYLETEALAVAPYFGYIIREIRCEKQRVRLMSLAPGAQIFEHYDREESLDAGVVRLHIPIVTNSDIDFYLGRQRQYWRVGELWYGDFSFPHWLRNRGEERRVHMVLDCVVNEDLLSLFPCGYASQKRFRRLYRKLMLTEFDWRRRLRSLSGAPSGS